MYDNNNLDNSLDKIFKSVDNLKIDLVNSSIYKNYLLAQEKLTDNDLLLLKEYKHMHFDFINNNNFETEKIISNIYSRLMLNNRTREFLECELILTNCLKSIYSRIAHNLNINVFA